jgi:hypothetical protein
MFKSEKETRTLNKIKLLNPLQKNKKKILNYIIYKVF